MTASGYLHQLLARAVDRHPQALAVQDESRALTFEQLALEVANLARGLNLHPGQRVAVLSRNRAEFLIATLAIHCSGAVVVPINWRLAADEVSFILRDSAAVAILADLAALPQVEAQHQIRRICLENPCPASWEPFGQLLAAQSAQLAPSAPGAGVQFYTSGTTGRPKGVVLTDQNLEAFIHTWVRETDLCGSSDRVFLGSPMMHVGGLVMSLCALATGAGLLLRTNFDARRSLEALAQQPVTHALFVPAMLALMLSEGRANHYAFPQLRRIVYGASPIPAAMLVEALRFFGCGFVQGYGLTETTGALTVLRPADHLSSEGDAIAAARLLSAGQCLDCCELRIVDADGRDVATGQVGEVVARGANVFSGYWNDPSGTQAAFRDGWFHTGDMAKRDAAGYVTIVDRKKDMLILGGENVYPSEVERVLRLHPSVREAAVVGLPHPLWGEEIAAAIVPQPTAQLDRYYDRHLAAHCRSLLANFKCPTRFALLDSLPLNGAGKVDKRALRALLIQRAEPRS